MLFNKTGLPRQLLYIQRRKMNYTYMVKCKDGTYYTGWTTNLDRRIAAHNSGTGAKYTKGRGPVTLAYYEEHEKKTDAMRREWEIKQLSRKEKEMLAKDFCKGKKEK